MYAILRNEARGWKEGTGEEPSACHCGSQSRTATLHGWIQSCGIYFVFHLCVYSVIHILLLVHQFTWYMYKMLTGLHEQMEKLTNCLPHCPCMNNIP